MQELGQTILLFDGGMGSELVKAGFSNVCPEDLNVTEPLAITRIHESYQDADFITTNTFGLNRLKYKGEYKISKVVECAIQNARKTGKKVFFDIGPTGKLLKPLGTLDFDEAYEAFREVVLLSRDFVDGYILETFSDLYELKSALLAVKENSDKPVFCTMTFDKNGRTLTGTTPEIMVAFLEEMGVDALGVNCSLGPNELYNVVTRILNSTHTPVILQPNRGLPRLKDGQPYYDLTVEEFSEGMQRYTQLGVSILGGCCGTTPECIHAISQCQGKAVFPLDNPKKPYIASYSRLVELSETTVFFALSLTEDITEDACEDIAYDVLDMVDEGVEVIELQGDDIEVDILRTFVNKIQEFSNVPLRLKSNDERLQECFHRYYNGTAKSSFLR